MGSGNCTADSSGDLLCTATSSAPAPATDTWTIYTYATTSPIVGTTTPLSIYTGYVLPVTVAGPNLASVATFGVPAALVFPPSSVNLVAIDSFFTQTTSVQVQDAGGATIIGGDNFSDANGNTGSVQFTGCDTHLTPTPSTFIASNQTALAAQSTISVAYDNAGSVGTTLHCSATALGGLTAQYSVNLIAPSITESTIPTANSNPIDITAGPDGALWFTEYGGNKIGRITTSGNITEFPLPGNSRRPSRTAVRRTRRPQQPDRARRSTACRESRHDSRLAAVMFACTIDYSLTGEPYAELVERIARRECQNGSAWRDVATTLPFETEAQAEVAGKQLLGELVAAIDTGGKTKWTHVFECDDCGVNKVAVFDPYRTCALVLCAPCNGGEAAAGPIYYAE